jgi:hypothetical protein
VVIRIPLYSRKIHDFGSKTQISGGSEWTFDSPRLHGRTFAVEARQGQGSFHAGEGRLIGVIENSGFMGTSLTVYQIEYTQSNGAKSVVGSGRPVGLQAENLRNDEIM